MTTHRPLLLLPLVLALLAACLPSMPEGERGVQCWTDHEETSSRCTTNFLYCSSNADSQIVAAECEDTFETCVADAIHEAQQCESRTGCISTLIHCYEDCALRNDQGSCQTTCETDFERCAPWYQPDCERDCQLDLTMDWQCQVASDVDDFVECEQERLECVLECYD